MLADPLQTDITYLKGVGPIRAKLLADEIGVRTFRDLIYHFPYRYVDRSVVYRVSDLQGDMPYVLLRGRLVSIETIGEGAKRRLKAMFTDGTGYAELVWFNSIKYVESTLKVNLDYCVFGKPTNYNGRISFAHPEVEVYDDEAKSQPVAMLPFYHTTDKMKRRGLDSRQVGDLVNRVFEVMSRHEFRETLPDSVLRKYNLCPLGKALLTAHRPAMAQALPEALRRLKFEEFFYLQLDVLCHMKQRKLNQAGYVFARVGDAFNRFYRERLPFELTVAQKRVIREVRSDVATGRQMNRLIQGDVGSGKTMVALMCCLLAVDNGFQACIMAPTEILAMQHMESLAHQLGSLPIRVALLTGNVKGKQRREVLQGVADGSINILVGTHALIEPSVQFLNLGLAVIDEQHRFGVKQRAKLWAKNTLAPHILVMTATPIPRTLSMTIYGDLDTSAIDELPPGRKPVITVHYRQNDRAKLYEGLRSQLREGRQAYVVYPLIKENEKQNLHDLETGYNHFVEVFREYRVGMVHGKMAPGDKEIAMQRFKEGHTHILVSTTVIEVGVNVPNASVMVIENAENFGLAQLHQLRGRVGRGSEQAFCVLMTKNNLNETSRRRMQIMVDSTDGFVIAEEDMKLRGPGDMEGTAQSGMPFDLKVANLVKDGELLGVAREAARFIVETDPQESNPAFDLAWQQLRILKKQQVNFSAIS